MFASYILIVFLPFTLAIENGWIFYAPTGMLSYGRMDPILYPGQVSPHVHQFQGANALQSTYHYDTIRSESSCTNIQVSEDLSNYWSPAMYSYNGAGNFSLMLASFHVYYFGNTRHYSATNTSGIDKRLAFPEGFSMLAGNLNSRQVNWSDPTTYAAIFNCLRSVNGSYSYDLRDFQRSGRNCDLSLRSTVNFPSCWNGVNVTSPDGRAHVAYPVQGVCPKSHPVALMELLYEYYWPVQDFPFDSSREDNWVLSFGDTSGFGMHADFTTGWPTKLLQRAINKCSHLTEIGTEKCPPFAPFQGGQIAPCMPSGLYPNENVGLEGESLTALPGCNKLWTDNSTKPTCDADEPAPIPSIDLTLGPDLSSWNYLGCPMQYTATGPILEAVWQTGLKNLTVDSCLATCKTGGYKYAGLTWGSVCMCDNKLQHNGTATSDRVYACSVRCGPNYLEFCGGLGSVQLYEACSGDACQANSAFPPRTTASASWSQPTTR